MKTSAYCDGCPLMSIPRGQGRHPRPPMLNWLTVPDCVIVFARSDVCRGMPCGEYLATGLSPSCGSPIFQMIPCTGTPSQRM